MKLHDLTVSAAAAGIRRREFSPVELVEAFLARIDAVESRVKGWAFLDRDGAQGQARHRASEMARGALVGPLHGVPFAVKDIFYTAGLPTEAGSKVYAGFVPSYDAMAVARLKEAGAILLGKLQTTEFAMFDPAPTHNPWNLTHTPGGSSSGSAAAVSARMVPGALGSQTGGSLLRPASYCGIVGLKPTFGRVSLRGVIPVSWTQDHIGPMARTVEDVALLLKVMAGHDPVDPRSAREPVPDYLVAIKQRRAPRIGFVRDFFPERTDLEVFQATRAAADRLAQAGAGIEEAQLPPTFGVIHAASSTIMQVEVAAFHAELYAKGSALYAPGIRSVIEIGSLIPGEMYLRAIRIRHRFRREINEVLTRFDVLLTPSTPAPAPEGLERTGDPAFQVPWSAAGLPSITLPAGLSSMGLPLGIQLIAAPFAEERLLAVAAWCEDVLGPMPAPPL